MANTKISQLPQYSATVNPDIYFVNNNSGETETTKIKLSEFQGLTQGQGTHTIQSNTYFGDLGTTAMTENSIAIGNGAEATSPRSIAIGYRAFNINRDFGRTDYIAIGTRAQCVQNGVGIGLDVNCIAEAVAIGQEAGAFGNQSTAINYQSKAFGNHSVAVGYKCETHSNGCIAMGDDARSEGNGAVAIGGVSTEVVGDYSVNIGGFSNTLNSNYSTILGGSGNTITSSAHTAMIGCIDRTATTSGATFVENLVIFNYANLDFADDAAAATGGVVLGQVYHTSGALKIRIT
jgi:hypothetical protein